MSDKEALLRNARKKGRFQALKVLIEGTEELTDWTCRVGKDADYITYGDSCSKRRMVTYGDRGEGRPLDADVSHLNNQFGGTFDMTKDQVYARLKEYLPHACKGYGTRDSDYVAIRDEEDAEKFLEFLGSFPGSETR